MLILAVSAYGIIGDLFLIYTTLYFKFPCNEQNSLLKPGKEITKKPYIYMYIYVSITYM